MNVLSESGQSVGDNAPLLLVPNVCVDWTVQRLEMASATNVTDGRPATVADTELSPTASPRVHDPTVAIPEVSVVTVAPETDPPPLTTANVTVAPPSGDPF